jgi:probable HAF family extracellular repeat protein
MNSQGDVAGGSTFLSTSTTNHPFLFHNGALMDLGLPPGVRTGTANGVNDFDQVVGDLTSGPRRQAITRAFLWQNGAFADLGTLGGNWAVSAGINNAVQVVGTSINASGEIMLTSGKTAS